MATIDEFAALDLRVGTVLSAKLHPTARKPAYQLEIDFGPIGIKWSSAQLTALYQPADLVGLQIVAVTNFPPRRIGDFVSEVLVLGAMQADGRVILLTTERPAMPGDRIG
ncbi:tRNA-binding protein [Sulfoacidibacillus thermotolerans]|uniref:tRNA-binding protein n=1 Tax=Sulfoacidibacillus thermotolerans TaxID=1765684 RepID=A0A2U3D8N9_SULT2|nr:tRNA-binding protein [Sulfoacidibacillus thermotolerans]PWI57638.1 tRNA-binding protein [Sulfoacidibacillus thermotolerans]